MVRKSPGDHGLQTRRRTDSLGANVDADAYRLSGVGPFRALAHRLADEPIRERHDESGLLREGNELRWGDQLAVPLPTHERFESDDLAIGHVEQWLVVQAHLAPLERLPEVIEGPQARCGVTRVCQRRGGPTDRAVADRARRGLGGAPEHRARIPMLRRTRDTDAPIDAHQAATDDERRAEGVEGAAGEDIVCADGTLKHRELV